MSSMPEITNHDEQITDSPNEDIVYAAQLALAAFHPTSPEQVTDMLLFWRRRDELTVADVAEVCARMFPQPLERMECPAWCDYDHSRESYNAVEDLCSHHRDVLVERDESGRLKLEVSVTVTDNLTDRTRGEAGIHIYADEPLPPEQALRMIDAVRQGLNIING